MPPDGIIYLFVISFVGTPIVVETATCYYPSPEKSGVVWNWKEKKWSKKFDLKEKKYYYTLEEESSTDNFIEKKMRKRYLQKGKRCYVKGQADIVEDVPKGYYVQEKGFKKIPDK